MIKIKDNITPNEGMIASLAFDGTNNCLRCNPTIGDPPLNWPARFTFAPFGFVLKNGSKYKITLGSVLYSYYMSIMTGVGDTTNLDFSPTEITEYPTLRRGTIATGWINSDYTFTANTNTDNVLVLSFRRRDEGNITDADKSAILANAKIISMDPVKKITTKVSNTRLPNTYQEVKYIGSTGGQYIDTGYTPVPGDSIEIRNANYNVGALYYAGTNDYQIGILQLASTASRFVTYFKYCRSGAAQEIPRLENGPYKIKQKGNGDLFINDKFVSNSSPTSTGPNTQLFIGRRPNNENQYFVGYYGEVIVTNSSNTIVRNLIPCYRKSDNVIGMYDLANNVFYTNSGSGSFTKGPNISSQVDIKYIKTKHNNTMVEVFNDNFNNYQEVEYLNFNGHQAIMPLSTFTPTFGKFYMKIYQPQSGNKQFLIFGYATFNNTGGSISKQNANLYTTNSNLYWEYRGNSTISNSINNSDILEITLDNTNKKMTINGTDYDFPSSYNNACGYSREVFVVGGEVYEDRFMFTGRMYSFKYYDDGGNNLLVDLVPCYRKSDNKPGMYDKVHNTFYTNVGTGDFTVGPDV